MYHVNRAGCEEYLIMLTEEHEEPIVQMLSVTWKGLRLSEVNRHVGFSCSIASEAFGALNAATFLRLSHI